MVEMTKKVAGGSGGSALPPAGWNLERLSAWEFRPGKKPCRPRYRLPVFMLRRQLHTGTARLPWTATTPFRLVIVSQ